MMNWKETLLSGCNVWSVVCFLTIENNSGAKINRPLGTDYRKENVVKLKNVQRQQLIFLEERRNTQWQMQRAAEHNVK